MIRIVRRRLCACTCVLVALLGVGGAELVKDAQPDLFSGNERQSPTQLDQTVDEIRDRFGGEALSRARAMDPDQIR